MKINFLTNMIKRYNENTTPCLVSGFTLIELMIATTLFTIIMLMGVGSLVVSSNSAKASQKLRVAVDNVNFAMESMARELRMGTYYSCGTEAIPDLNILGNCSGNLIAFKPQQIGGAPTRVFYGYLKRNDTEAFTLMRCEDSTTIGACMPIVSNDVVISTLKFIVTGPNIEDKIQPSVLILLTGSVTIKGDTTNFSLQTLASQRSAEKLP